MEKETLNEKVAAVFKDLGAVSKTGFNQAQGFSFRSYDEMASALHPIMARHGVFITPKVISFEREERTTKSGSIQTYTIVMVEYQVRCDTSDSCIIGCSYGEAADTGDKSMGKAMTYAYKKFLEALFTICSSEREDPDAYSPSEAVEVVKSEEYKKLQALMKKAKTMDELMAIWNENPKMHTILAFREDLSRCKSALKK